MASMAIDVTAQKILWVPTVSSTITSVLSTPAKTMEPASIKHPEITSVNARAVSFSFHSQCVVSTVLNYLVNINYGHLLVKKF